MQNRKLGIVACIILVVLLPLLIDWLIIGNDFPSNIENSDWVGFLGSYIGSIVSMIGIVLTIWYTNQQNRKDRELSIKPYCLVKLKPVVQSEDIESTLRFYFEYNPNAKETDVERETNAVVYWLEIENVGVGPAVDCQIQQCSYCQYGSREIVEHGMDIINRVDCIPKDNNIISNIQVIYEAFPNPNHEKWKNTCDGLKERLATFYPRCELPYLLTYSDILGTKYEQSFSLIINFWTYYNHAGKLTKEPTCEVKLDKISAPIRVRMRG